MRFDLSFKSDDHVKLYLDHLGLPKEGPSLVYLNQIIFAHQHQILFETLTRIEDYFDYLDHLMPLPVYIERLKYGCGGVCWTLARGFHWLITSLGFDAQYYYMDPGHVCVIVKLPEGMFYCDVGYAAPFFQAKPLLKSFLATSGHEIFKYEVKNQSVVVTRTPGPTKTLILRPQTPAEINAQFEKANIIGSKFLCNILVSRYVNKKLLRLNGDRIIGDGPERSLSQAEIVQVLEKRFEIDPSFYHRARVKLGQ